MERGEERGKGGVEKGRGVEKGIGEGRIVLTASKSHRPDKENAIQLSRHKKQKGEEEIVSPSATRTKKMSFLWPVYRRDRDDTEVMIKRR